MSQRARSEAESGVREESGLVPNSTPMATSARRIHALTPAELAEVAPGRRGLQSGAFTKRPDGSSALDWNSFRAPPPPPSAAGVSVPPRLAPERAELQIADFSLQLANPFIGSSLLPPPPKKRPWLKPLLISLGGVLLLGAGYAGAMYQQLPRTTQVATRGLPPVAAGTRATTVENVAAKVGSVEQTSVEVATPVVAITPATTMTQPVSAQSTRTTTEFAKPAASRVEKTARRVAKTKARARAEQQTTGATASADAKDEADMDERAPIDALASAPKAPQQLTRAQVQSGLETVRPALNTCAAGARGQIMANVTVSGAGRVSHASIEGSFAGTPQGSCMARALRAAQFPAFTAPQLRVRYPFVF